MSSPTKVYAAGIIFQKALYIKSPGKSRLLHKKRGLSALAFYQKIPPPYLLFEENCDKL
jgi:hypothetical protein